MNNRLTKLEYNETKKIALLFITILSVYQVISIIIGLFSRHVKSSLLSDLPIIIMLCSTLGIITGTVIIIKRFYNVLFSNEGLIKLAMPVKNSEHLKVNIKTGLILVYILVFIFIAGIGLGEISSGERFWGVANAYKDLKTFYIFDDLTNAGMKAALTIILHVITVAVVIANLYISCNFAITLASRITGKFNIIQKNGVLFICLIAIYTIKVIFTSLGYRLLVYIDDLADQNAFPIKAFPLNTYTFNLSLDISCIVIYGLSAAIMYLICKSILDNKLDI